MHLSKATQFCPGLFLLFSLYKCVLAFIYTAKASNITTMQDA